MGRETSELGAELRSTVSALQRRYRSQRPAGELGDAALTTLLRLQKEGPQTLTALSEHLGVTPASASQAVTRLVDLGFAERRRDDVDRRRVLLRATPAGLAIAQTARTRAEGWFDSRLDALEPEERALLAVVLPILRKLNAPGEERDD